MWAEPEAKNKSMIDSPLLFSIVVNQGDNFFCVDSFLSQMILLSYVTLVEQQVSDLVN